MTTYTKSKIYDFYVTVRHYDSRQETNENHLDLVTILFVAVFILVRCILHQVQMFPTNRIRWKHDGNVILSLYSLVLVDFGEFPEKVDQVSHVHSGMELGDVLGVVDPGAINFSAEQLVQVNRELAERLGQDWREEVTVEEHDVD